MRALVAGSTGLAGSAIMRKLSQIGESPVGISSTDVDLTNREKVFEYFLDLKPELVFCCAAKVGGIGANVTYPVEFLSTNLQIQTNVMDASHTAGVERLVFLGSSCIYPRNCPQPMEETFLLTGIPEETNRSFAIAKIAGIELVRSYRQQFGRRWISVIPTNLYGPGDNYNLETSHVLAALIRKFAEAAHSNTDVTVWGTGNVLRDFLHSDDLADALIMLVEKYDAVEPINIGSGAEVSIRELVEAVAKATNFKGNIIWDHSKPDGTPRKVLSNKNIHGLGWQPKIVLDVGIKRSIAEFQSNFLS